MASALRELLAIFDINVDPEHNLEKGHKNVEGFQKKLEEVARTVGEAFAVKEVYEFVHSQIEAAARVGDLAERLDVSATLIRNFGYAAGTAGVDSESAARSLGFLEKNLGEAALKGGASAAIFQKIGVGLKDAHGNARPMADVLGDVAEGLAKLPDQNQRAAVAMQLFGREGRSLLPILKDGREGIARLLGEADELGNGLGDEYYENAKKAQDATEKLTFTIQSIKDRAIALLLPYVQDFIDVLQGAAKWSLEHAKTTKVLEYALGGLAFVIGIALVDALATAAVALWALLAPFIPIAVAIGAVVWILQDLYKAMTGADSAIADFLVSLGGVGTRAHLVGELNSMWQTTKEVIDDAAYALGFFLGVWAATFGKLAKSEVGQTWAEAMRSEFGELTDALLGAGAAALALLKSLEAIPKAIKALSLAPVLKAIDSTLDPIFGDADKNEKGFHYGSDVTEHGVPQSYVDEWNKHPHAQAAGGPDQAASFAAAGGLLRPGGVEVGAGGGVHQVNHNSIVIHTKSDKPKEVGDAVGEGVSSRNQKDLRNALASAVTK